MPRKRRKCQCCGIGPIAARLSRSFCKSCFETRRAMAHQDRALMVNRVAARKREARIPIYRERASRRVDLFDPPVS